MYQKINVNIDIVQKASKSNILKFVIKNPTLTVDFID